MKEYLLTMPAQQSVPRRIASSIPYATIIRPGVTQPFRRQSTKGTPMKYPARFVSQVNLNFDHELGRFVRQEEK